VNRNVALIYVRVSRLDAEERGRKLSPAMQREKALAVRELEGVKTIEYADLDISGKDTAHRPQYLAMMERLTTGDVRYVVAYDLSRVTRTVRDQADFFEALHRHGALFLESATGRVIDPQDEDEELGANVLGSVNQHYRKKTARRIRDSLATKVARGELVGPVPAGYLRRKEVLPSGKVARTWVEPDPERAPTIQLIFREYASGRWSLKSLARELNTRGVPLVRAPHFKNNRPRAELWTADVLKDLLVNPRYVGDVPRRDGQTFAAAYPPLITRETWDACGRVRVEGRRIRLSTAAHRPSRYLLSGVLRCWRCGSTMSGWSRKPDRRHETDRFFYMCYQRRVAARCDAPSIAQSLLEDEMREVFETLALPKGFAEAVDAAVAEHMGRRDRGNTRATVAGVNARLERLRDVYELGDLTRDEYLRRRDDLQRQREVLTSPEPVFVRQRTLLRSMVEEWDEMTLDERKRLIAVVFEEIQADAEGLRELVPHEEWKACLRSALPKPRVLSERKTGLEPATPTLARLCSTN
jgi:site-specific DNA recombinase